MSRNYRKLRTKFEFIESSGASIILIVLLDHGELSYSDIKEKTGLPTHTAYRTLNSLLKNNLIEEKREEEFPRRRLFKLTDRGRKIAEKLVEIEDILND